MILCAIKSENLRCIRHKLRGEYGGSRRMRFAIQGVGGLIRVNQRARNRGRSLRGRRPTNFDLAPGMIGGNRNLEATGGCPALPLLPSRAAAIKRATSPRSAASRLNTQRRRATRKRETGRVMATCRVERPGNGRRKREPVSVRGYPVPARRGPCLGHVPAPRAGARRIRALAAGRVPHRRCGGHGLLPARP